MILTLEVTGQPAANLGAGRRKEFGSAGGLIGRLPDNDWVLPGEYVSGHHARIQFRNGQFVIEDTSTNGVSINSPENRLQRGRPYPLKSGDRILIDLYEISATVAAGERAREQPAREPAASSPMGSGARKAPFIPDDPFAVEVGDEPPAFGDHVRAAHRASSMGADPFAGITDPVADAGEADPLRVLGLESRKAPPAPRSPRASDLAAGSPLNEPYQAPVVRQPQIVPPLIPEEPLGSRPPEGHPPGFIPADYDPLAPDEPRAVHPAQQSARPSPAARPGSAAGPQPSPRVTPPAAPAHSAEPAAPRRPTPGASPQRPPERAASSAGSGPVPAKREDPRGIAAQTPAVEAPRAAQRESAADPFAGPPASRAPGGAPVGIPGYESARRATPAPVTVATSGGSFDFGAFLQGVGLQGVEVSPELARDFGQVLRVVIEGLMEILRARERIKDEFRMRVTTFKAADNNPLKFSANVEDALHNLLVKRNAAYLGPVQAFEDAFRDVRNHQMAMLAGVRLAYEAMLGEFDPEHLQEQFDRQLKKGSLLGARARSRYWDLYVDRFRDRVRDADACFRQLFGDEFAKAYEEQLEKLRALARANDK